MPAPAQVTLPSDREVRVTRQFNAPRQLVYDAHTKPELVTKWMVGYPGWDMPVCEMDVRVGGRYKWQWRSQEDGKQFGFFGTFTEVNAPSRIAHEEYYRLAANTLQRRSTVPRHNIHCVDVGVTQKAVGRLRLCPPAAGCRNARCGLVAQPFSPQRAPAPQPLLAHTTIRYFGLDPAPASRPAPSLPARCT